MTYLLPVEVEECTPLFGETIAPNPDWRWWKPWLPRQIRRAVVIELKLRINLRRPRGYFTGYHLTMTDGDARGCVRQIAASDGDTLIITHIHSSDYKMVGHAVIM